MKRRTILGLVVVVVACANANASVISGQISQLSDSQITGFGDGTHDIRLFWSVRNYNEGYLYGSSYAPWWPTLNSDLALAPGVTDISQICDASSYTFVDSNLVVRDAFANPNQVGDFVVYHNINTGHYGVLRIDYINCISMAMPIAELNASWWFQTDGTCDFSSVPEPAGLVLLLCSALWRRR